MNRMILGAAAYALLLAGIPLSAEAGTQTHVHAMFTASPESAEDCHTASARTRTVPPYGFVYASACVLDEGEQPVETLGSSQWVRWEKTGPVSIYEAATETDDRGHVPVTIRIDGLGTAQIAATLCSDVECTQVSSQATLELHIVHQDPPPPHCGDGVDNDGDGQTDFPNDPDCGSEEDEESDVSSPPHWVLSIRYNSPHFVGRLADYEPRCEARRFVRVKKVRPGADRLIGRDRTNRRGAWEVRQPHARGRFYAMVRRAKRFEGERVISCPANRSVTIVIR